ncbi:hypothetical protein LOZ66_003462 [Ophidiomyces ophidiicola]|nr:hypothetical protein LOZ66_003462 [Ophidiomyces ophidiicola]
MPFVLTSRLALSRAASRFRSHALGSLTTFQCQRHYGRMLKTIVSKHVTSIADVVRPTITPGLRSLPQEISKLTKSFAPTHTQESKYGAQKALEKAAEAPEDDISTEPYSLTAIDTIIQSQVRSLMRLVPHAVAIITSTFPNNDAASAFRGMTVSSFNTVTLYPDPIVSFNVKVPSETYDAILSSQRFLVHLLSSNMATARLAREFSRGHENILLEDKKGTFRFASLSSPHNLPAISEGEPPLLVIQEEEASIAADNDSLPNFPFILECRYHPSSIRVGDHVVVLGTVMKICCEQSQRQPQQSETYHSTNELCLTYADTRFWKIGEPVTPLPRKGEP